MTNEPVLGTTIAIAAIATTTATILNVWLFIAFSISSKQPGGLDGEDQRHRRVQREVGNFGEQGLAEIVGEADQQRADRSAAEAAHAADDHHGERDRQHLEVETDIDAKKGAADNTAEGRERRA